MAGTRRWRWRRIRELAVHVVTSSRQGKRAWSPLRHLSRWDKILFCNFATFSAAASCLYVLICIQVSVSFLIYIYLCVLMSKSSFVIFFVLCRLLKISASPFKLFFWDVWKTETSSVNCLERRSTIYDHFFLNKSLVYSSPWKLGFCVSLLLKFTKRFSKHTFRHM
jgi:hypothetical protein